MSSKSEKNKRLRKAKSGKIDVIEDIMGTEVMKGTYEDRDKTAKLLAIDKAHQLEAHRMKLRAIRGRELEVWKAQLPTKEEEALRQQRIEYILLHLCEPRAFEYLDYLRNNQHDLCKQIVYCLFKADDMMDNLETLCARIFKHGAPKKRIDMRAIVKWMKALTGRKTKIEVEENGIRRTI